LGKPKNTSLMLFSEKSDEIIMHRIVQSVLLLKISNNDKDIKSYIKFLLDYFSKEYLNTRTAYVNFTFFLRNIINRKIFYEQVNLSDKEVIKCLLQVARSYKQVNEVDQAILFYSDAIKNINMHTKPELHDEIKNELIEVLSTNFNLSNINEDWLKELLQKLNPERDAEIIDVLLEKEKQFTQNPDRFEGESYYPTIKAIANAIIFNLTKVINAFDVLVYKTTLSTKNEKAAQAQAEKQLAQKKSEQLASAYYILGHAFRENASGINTQIQRAHKEAEEMQAKKDSYPVFWWSLHSKISQQIEELYDEIEELEKEFTNYCILAKNHLKESINLRRKLNQTDSYSYLNALKQVIRLYQIYEFSTIDNSDPQEIAKTLVSNRELLEKYESNHDILRYCKEFIQENPGLNKKPRIK